MPQTRMQRTESGRGLSAPTVNALCRCSASDALPRRKFFPRRCGRGAEAPPTFKKRHLL